MEGGMSDENIFGCINAIFVLAVLALVIYFIAHVG